MLKDDRVPIDLSTGLYKSFSRYDYTPWHATAEFVDNAIQSYIENKNKLKKIHKNFKLIIEINMSSSQIEIKDNAGGIKEDNLSKLFDPYFTTKHQSQGTGMGLYNIYNMIVGTYSGSFKITNTENGVLNEITLPIIE